MIVLASFALAGCLAVGAGSDRITAADLAPRFPGLDKVTPETLLGLAPAPGVRRVFDLPELRRIASRFSLPAAPEEGICVERPVAPADTAKFLAAMRRALPDAAISILECSRQPVPEGEVEFPLAALRNGSGGSLWMGFVRYAGNRRFTVWARVKVLAPVVRVLAIGDLKPGQPIAAGQLQVRSSEEFPAAGAFAPSVDQVVGKWPRIPIRAGSPIRTDQLMEPKEVMSGETVRVEVRSGGARLEFEARALVSGATGETIAVRNPSSQKRFPARVEGKGRVVVESPAERTKP
jgi:flagella basal body P-ring formation protein FlgA